ELDGSHGSRAFVSWYSGHPDAVALEPRLDHRAAVVVGAGNVALDVARVLTMDPDRLADTEIAPRALAALRASEVEEVVVTGRRAPIDAAFTLPELVGLATAPGIDLQIDASDEEIAAAPKLALVRSLERPGGRRRVTLRFHLTPTAALGDGRLAAVEFGTERIGAGLLLTSIGYGASPIPGLPFDADSRTVPNDRGRVIDPASGIAIPRTYVTGWIKRGPTGFLGTNRSDSKETVMTLVEDLNAERLRRQVP
ncbi:MAG: 4Fe-4S ferredoxin, partial [Gammaproteobacteria bacterium]